MELRVSSDSGDIDIVWFKGQIIYNLFNHVYHFCTHQKRETPMGS